MLDPSFTLFGKRIQVNGDGESEVEDSPRSNNEEESSIEKSSSDEQLVDEVTKEITEEESMENDQQDDSSAEAMDESTNGPAVSETTDQTEKAVESEKDSEPEQDEQDEKESNDTKNSQQKQLKKPDKILPCPRCNSMDTKFCYYNNYNVNQPRHFCKSCQRYWTAGGTMRNVPVGAGRRKNKSSASRYCHITVSEALQAARFDVSNGVHHPGLKNNGTVLTFGSDNPLCESMTSVLNIADKKACGTTRNGFHNVDHVVPGPSRGMDNGDDHSSGSTVTTSSAVEDPSRKGAQEPQQHMNGFTNQMPYFQWPYMWNPAAGPVPPPFCPSAYPMPMYPPPYWNGAPVPWNVSWVPQYSPSQNSPGSNQSSPTLGKHTRDGEMITPTDNDRSSQTPTSTTTTTTPTTTSTVLMPKTLRIDDPDEAAKSSIWTTLGIKKDKADSARKGFFSSFNSKEAERTDSDIEAPEAFKANPVALCRSFSFQEKA